MPALARACAGGDACGAPADGTTADARACARAVDGAQRSLLEELACVLLAVAAAESAVLEGGVAVARDRSVTSAVDAFLFWPDDIPLAQHRKGRAVLGSSPGGDLPLQSAQPIRKIRDWRL
jgi:hypothetical protein